MTDDNHGADNIRQMFEDGETIPPEPPDHDGDAGGGGVARKRAKGPPWTLPEDAPVEPLGISGDYYYFIDANRQLRTVRDDKMSRGKTQGLFGCHISYLYDVYPRLKAVTIDGKECWIVTGWMPEAAEEALRHACASRGVWDVMNRGKSVV